MSLRCLPSSFGSIRLTVWGEMFEDVQDGRHLGYRNRTIFNYSESLCRSDASHPVSAQSDLRFGRRCRLIKFPDVRHGGNHGYRNGTILAILNLCHSDVSHQVSAQSVLRFVRRCRLKIFKMVAKAANLDIGTERFYQF